MSQDALPVEPRIMGLEWEMAVLEQLKDKGRTGLTARPGLFHRPFEGVTSYYSSVPHSITSGGQIHLTNGARWYQDTRANAEHATPECAGAAELTEYAVGSEYFVGRAIAQYTLEKRIIRVHRRASTPGGTDPVGLHENYSVSNKKNLDLDRGSIASQLFPFLVARILFNGAGEAKMGPSDEPVIIPGQRSQYVQSYIDATATSLKKPWILDRNENLSGASGDLRLQVTGGDPNMSPWATHFTFMSTSIVLRMIENHLSIDAAKLDLDKAAQITQRAALDHNGSATFEDIADDEPRRVKAIDILESYFLSAWKEKDSGIFSQDEIAFLPEWGQAIDEYRQDRFKLRDAVDFICKQWIAEEGGISSLAKLQLMDMRYDAIAGIPPEQRIAQRLRAAGHFRRHVSDKAIEHTLYHAPTETRAHIRAKINRKLHRLPDSKFQKMVEWDYMQMEWSSGPQKNVRRMNLSDPRGRLSERDQTELSKLHGVLDNLIA